MSQKKNYLYEDVLRNQAYCFFLLGHCERMRVLEELDDVGPLTFAALYEDSPLARSTFAQHMRLLGLARLIEPIGIGKKSGYRVCEEGYRYAMRQMAAYLERRLERKSEVA